MSTPTRSRKLTLDDIADLRAYERERESLRARIIDLKSRRRVSLGHIVTLTFENRDTMRHQIQEMARAEKIVTDEGIQDELDIYNPIIPEPGQLCATVFIELTSDEQMRVWLPKLVGIERSFVFRLPDGSTRSARSPKNSTRASSPAPTSPPPCTTSTSSSPRRRWRRSSRAPCWRSITRPTPRRSSCCPRRSPSCARDLLPDAG
jgi:hypothetical protein